MKYTAIILNIAVISLAVFGFFSMRHMSEHASGFCLTSLMTEAACDGKINPIVSAGFHTEALNSIFRVVVGNSILLFLTYLLIALVVFIPKYKPKFYNLALLKISRLKTVLPAKISFRQWLALFEKRDPAPGL